MEYLWGTFFLFWNSLNQHTINFSRSTEHSVGWETWLCHTSSMCSDGITWQRKLHPCGTFRNRWLASVWLSCLIFWMLMELETCKKKSCILLFLCCWLLLQYWIPSPRLIHDRLAAVALLVLEDEESAFWCLVYIVEHLMPADYYSDTLITSQVSWAPSHLLGLSYSDLQ